jgi:hypothetical protein
MVETSSATKCYGDAGQALTLARTSAMRSGDVWPASSKQSFQHGESAENTRTMDKKFRALPRRRTSFCRSVITVFSALPPC